MLHPQLAALLLLVSVVGMLDTGVAVVVEVSTSGHHPPLFDCGPAPKTTPSKNDDAAFRANLSSALAESRFIAASVPEAVATMQVGRAFANGACFGSNVSSPACNACLSAAARDVIGRCGATRARAGVWGAECFVSYADYDGSSPGGEDAFRGWFYAGPTTPSSLDSSFCILDSGADLDSCLHDSARVAATLGWLQRIHGEEVLVVGYHCLLRVKISSLPRGPDKRDAKSVVWVLWMGLIVETEAIILGMVIFRSVKIARALPQVNG